MNEIQNWKNNNFWSQVPISTCVINQKYKIIEANKDFEDNYGNWKKKYCYSVYKGKNNKCDNCAAKMTFKDGKVRVREQQGLGCKNKEKYYLVHFVPLIKKDGTIPYVVEMSTDITKTKLLEKEKIEAERLAAVGQTVAGLAHGIKNLIMGLEGGMYIVSTGLKKGDAQRILTGWEILESNMERMTAFTKEFLEFARGKTPQVKYVYPNNIAKQIVDLFNDTSKLNGIKLKGDFQKNIAKALMDEDAIHTCLSNLVSNAIDACKISDKKNCVINVRTREKKKTIIFEVIDNGMGIDYEIKNKIFANFFSTKGSDKGTGLGLLTTRKIVQEHGGKVSFQSELNVGSTFRLEFLRDRLPKKQKKTKE